nr:DUF3597 family protein [Sphingobium terrigena]
MSEGDELASAALSADASSLFIGAVLTTMADMKEGGGNYQRSIVDLLKLLDLDSSLSAPTPPRSWVKS